MLLEYLLKKKLEYINKSLLHIQTINFFPLIP